jgi:uncharacterized protein YodC (DUF2158 family)
MKNKKQKAVVTIQVGSVVQLKSGGQKLTVVGADTFKGVITVIWASNNGNIGKADIPAAAIVVIKA